VDIGGFSLFIPFARKITNVASSIYGYQKLIQKAPTAGSVLLAGNFVENELVMGY
jgi:hypothetical protein